MIKSNHDTKTQTNYSWENIIRRILDSVEDHSNGVRSSFRGSWTEPKLSAIIRGKHSITEEIALDFADALGTSAEFWIGLQTDLCLWEAEKKLEKDSTDQIL